jgi:transposase
LHGALKITKPSSNARIFFRARFPERPCTLSLQTAATFFGTVTDHNSFTDPVIARRVS